MLGFNGGLIGATRSTITGVGVWTLREQSLARGNVLWIPDADAVAYIQAVEAADGQPLEYQVQYAIWQFIAGCKTDNIWTAIKAGCILAGARTLAGALVPLVGPAPTNFNFVTGDYNRKTGLLGNGSTKYLDSNTPHNIAPQNNVHVSVYASTAHSAGNRTYLDSVSGSSTSLSQDTNSPPSTWIAHDAGSSVPRFTDAGTGLKGVSRSSSASFVRRSNGSSTTVSRAASATAPGSGNFFVFSRTGTGLFSNGRLSFYSIGENLNLALLDARVTTLMDDIAAAIP